jgi:hypothetical protein
LVLCFDEALWLDDLLAGLSGLADFVEKPVNLAQFINDVPRGIAALDLDIFPAAATNETRVVLKLGKVLLPLMTALRARDRQAEFVDNSSGIAG